MGAYSVALIGISGCLGHSHVAPCYRGSTLTCQTGFDIDAGALNGPRTSETIQRQQLVDVSNDHVTTRGTLWHCLLARFQANAR